MIQDTERVAQWYREQLATLGPGLRAGDAAERESRLCRLDALSRLGDFDGRTVLEIGCGRGDFYAFLIGRGQRPLYTGVDVAPDAVQACRARFAGDAACRFELGSALDYQPRTRYDFVIGRGVFGFKTEDGVSITGRVLTRLFSWCGAGAAVNFPSVRPLGPAGRSHHVDPAAAVKSALRLTPSLVLLHEYLPDDFTLLLYRTGARDMSRRQGDAHE